jgi:hypothetical protein
LRKAAAPPWIGALTAARHGYYLRFVVKSQNLALWLSI